LAPWFTGGFIINVFGGPGLLLALVMVVMLNIDDPGMPPGFVIRLSLTGRLIYGAPAEGNLVVLSNIAAAVPAWPDKEILFPLKVPWWPNITAYPVFVL
jgi:hypothetical protein